MVGGTEGTPGGTVVTIDRPAPGRSLEGEGSGGGEAVAARRLHVAGRVQGVGFRPFVARLAAACGLAGWVKNTPVGVAIHLEGPSERLDEFRARLPREAPAEARIDELRAQSVAPCSHLGFSIDESEVRAAASASAEITPDLATCAACLAEFLDPADRRFGYALSGCSACGPRFTTLTSVPFDRARTALAAFPPCPDCLREYRSPSDRRFHAQNVVCPACGPTVWLEGDGGPIAGPEALAEAGRRLGAGAIVAVKGVGGFHLLCDATSNGAVLRLRARKRRGRKPLAVMFADLGDLGREALVDPAARDLLGDPSAPIVLVPRRPGGTLAEAIAPGLKTVGALIGYSLIHQGLLRAAGRPLVATSANASDEPMPIENDTARAELAGIADAFLLHDRPIVRHADDGLVRIIHGRPTWFRVGRGSAPLRVPAPFELPPMLATGGHLKAAVAFSTGREIVLGQHVGDLAMPAARRRYRATADDLGRLLGARPERVVCDLHPDYFTTRFARELGRPVHAVQHHEAHIAACLAEHGEAGPALGIAWDGTGFGRDGSIWGGEFFRFDGARFHRVGSLYPFPLVGGDRAAREPRLCAAGAGFAAGLWSEFEGSFRDAERRMILAAFLSKNCAITCTSAGRLFDAWAALLGLAERSSYEAEAAIRLEEIADEGEPGAPPVAVVEDSADGLLRIDWRPWVAEALRLRRQGVAPSVLSARFHNALAQGCLEVARRAGIGTVALSGGCFQNRFLAERVEGRLARDGFRVLTHRRVPPGDGGLAVGQLWACALGGFEPETKAGEG